MSDDGAVDARAETKRINAFYPILPRLGNQWAESRPWAGHTLGLNLHLTAPTAALVRELVRGGASVVISDAAAHPPLPGAADFLRELGADVYTADAPDRLLKVLDHQPDLLVDTGFDLIEALLEKRPTHKVRAAIALSHAGIERLRAMKSEPDLPVLNVTDGRLRDAVENRHGVGEGVWQAVTQLTGMHLAGRRLVVIGYGPVGRGLAAYARAANMSVEVVESDHIRRLFAHYDGYPTGRLEDALASAAFVVTATGRSNALPLDALRHAPSGVVLLNAGHGRDEIDVKALKNAAQAVEHVAEQVVRYHMESDGPDRTITVLGDGNPLNIVTNSGSPEPILLHLAVLGLALEWLAGRDALPPGETVVPNDIETRAATVALEALHPGVG
jgi:adenosylhomocysteinase